MKHDHHADANCPVYATKMCKDGISIYSEYPNPNFRSRQSWLLGKSQPKVAFIEYAVNLGVKIMLSFSVSVRVSSSGASRNHMSLERMTQNHHVSYLGSHVRQAPDLERPGRLHVFQFPEHDGAGSSGGDVLLGKRQPKAWRNDVQSFHFVSTRRLHTFNDNKRKQKRRGGTVL